MSKTHWKRLINPDYIGAYSLDEGKDLTVQITQVRRDIVVGTGGKKEECTIAYLKDQKPLILNNTNSKTISKLYGPYIEDWAGKSVTLFATTTKLAGDTVECLRIRPVVSKQQKPTLAEERLTAAIAQINAGNYTKEELFGKFALTKQQAERANAEIASV